MERMQMFKKKEKPPEERKGYKLKKMAVLRVLRALLWGMLLFVTIRGITAMIKPDQTNKVLERLGSVEAGTRLEIQQNAEVLRFAEAFVREWETYTSEEEFKSRLYPYVVPEVLELQNLHDFTGTTKVVRANAYRMKQYASGQFDVFVEAASTHTRVAATTETVAGNSSEIEGKEGKSKGKATEKAAEKVTETEARLDTVESTRVLKVPVQITEEGKYIVEGVPLYVDDQEYWPEKYQKTDVPLAVIEDVSKYQETITNYLKAYYSESRSVMEYYLSAEAEKEDLYGFLEAGEMELAGTVEVKAFRKAAGEVLCLVTYPVRDLTTQEMALQQCHMILDDSSADRCYIRDMNTKIFNLDIKEAEQ